jgi:hypothetical protein
MGAGKLEGVHAAALAAAEAKEIPMNRFFVLPVLLCLAMARPVVAQEADVSKSINLGLLADSFTLVSAEAGPHDDGIGIWLKLRAKKDVDTTDLYYQVGFFDKGKVVVQATPLRFQASFPLQTGETVHAYCVYVNARFEDGSYPWHTIVIRLGKKPT